LHAFKFLGKEKFKTIFNNLWIVARTKKPSNQAQATFSGMQTKNHKNN
jgi:hypothetical protein